MSCFSIEVSVRHSNNNNNNNCPPWAASRRRGLRGDSLIKPCAKVPTEAELISFASLPAGIFYYLSLRKIITPQSLLCLWSKIIRKASLAHHKSLFFSWKVDLLSFKKHGGRIGRKQTQKIARWKLILNFSFVWALFVLPYLQILILPSVLWRLFPAKKR